MNSCERPENVEPRELVEAQGQTVFEKRVASEKFADVLSEITRQIQ